MSEIARLLYQQGADAAAARRQVGALWGRAVVDTSQAPAQIIAQQDADRVRNQQLEIQRNRDTREAASAADAHEVHAAELDRMRQAAASDWAAHLLASKTTDPAAVSAEVDRQTGKLWKPEEAAAIKAQIATPETAAAFLTSLAPVPKPVKEPAGFTLGEGQTRFDANGTAIAWGSDKPIPKTQKYKVTVAGPDGKPIEKLVTEEELEKGIKPYEKPEKDKTADDVTLLTPAGIDLAALNYKKTGVMPVLGMGDKHARQSIVNRAATLTPDDMKRIEEGGNDIAGNKARYAADKTSLAALQKQRDSVGAFEETALKNLDVFLKTAKDVIDTGSPLVNQPLRAISKAVLGDPRNAAFETARRTVIPEFAKILSNPSLSGQLSDSARHEVEELVNGNASFKQILAVANVLRQDAKNRRTSLDDAIKTINGRLGSSKPSDAEVKAKDPLGIRE